MFADDERRIATRETELGPPLREAADRSVPRPFDPPPAVGEIPEPYRYFSDLVSSHILHALEVRPAYALPEPTPLEVWRRNLEIVTALLSAIGVDCFAVPGFGLTRPVVGVADADRRRVIAALAVLCDSTGGRLTAAEPPRLESAPVGTPVRPRTDLGDVTVVRADWLWTEPTRNLVFGAEYGCEVEFWTEDGGGRLVAPRRNRISQVVRRDSAPVAAPGRLFTPLAAGSRAGLPTVATRPEFGATGPEEVGFPIDVVYTWVDGDDRAWLRRRAEAAESPYHAESANESRFIDREELRYSLRSLYLNAPWVRHVYLVTDAQCPHWLDSDAPGVTVVDHRELFDDPECLPTFNSHAIETQLHRIDGLSEHFLYFNDDMFLGRPVAPRLFFEPGGLARFFPSDTFIDLDPVSAADTPPNAAFKNDRSLLEHAFGRTITRMVQHVPYPLQRSVLAEVEKEFGDLHARTAGSVFRDISDISVVTLQHYYAFLTGRAVWGTSRHAYLELGRPDLAERLAELLEGRDRETFCINDAGLTADLARERSTMLRSFLESYFPVPSPFERRAAP
ncbi:stealth family protein [Glycomyces xiaoerkulensis]|uniref:stealth family protein n=1 Tax=Glycomyces xiaoerkulensis TaxID=2038139 RepID=UPI000C25A1E0|nr:stealth family protein [Glycomyces xiaoerkulensis]